MTIQQELDDIHKDNDLFIDIDRAAKNRAIVERIIKQEDVMASKYDSLLPTILEDLKIMNLTNCERKNKIPEQCLSGILKNWKSRGMIPEDYVAHLKVVRKKHHHREKLSKEDNGSSQAPITGIEIRIEIPAEVAGRLIALGLRTLWERELK